MRKLLIIFNLELFSVFILLVCTLLCSCSSSNKDLYIAAQDCDISKMKAVVNSGATLAYTDNYGGTAIHKAALCETLTPLKFLLDQYPNSVNLEDNYGRTATYIVAGSRFGVERLDFLKRNGADIYKPSLRLGAHTTPLYAALAGHPRHLSEKTIFLLENGAKPTVNDYMLVIKIGDLNLLSQFLKYFKDINAIDIAGRNALLVAIEMKRVDIAEYLLDIGIDPSYQRGNFYPPEILAKENGMDQLSEKIIILKKEQEKQD